MRYAWFALSFLSLIFLAACRVEPTDTDPTAVATIGGLPLAAESTTLITLARNPAAFEGNLVRLEGQYKALPLPICTDEVHLPPGTWMLVDGEVEILAAGFDSVLRELANPGLPLIVEGSWQQWEGPVGCGRRAPIQDLWYLEVINIISPNPLTADGVAVVAGEGLDSLPAEVFPTPAEPGDAALEPGAGPIIPTATVATILTQPAAGVTIPTATQTVIPGTTLLTSTPTPSPLVTSSVTPLGTATVTATPSPTGQPGATTATATYTPGPFSTSTSQPGATATATGTAGTIDYDDIVKNNLTTSGVVLYDFYGDASDVVTINASPVQGLDISLGLFDPNGNSIANVNSVSSGQAETIGEQTLAMSGDYRISVTAVGVTSGDFALVLQSEDSLPFVVFQGNILYGGSQSRNIPADNDDLWNFQGINGDIITIRAVATTSEDVVLYLIGPDGFEIDFSDNDTDFSPPNDQEEIPNLTLTESGLYTIGVGESDFQAFGYTLTLSKQ